MTLEILTNVGTAKAFALGLREVQQLNGLLADRSEFGPQPTRVYKLAISKFFERFGRHEAALAALKDANQAAEEVQRLAGETARIELQEKLNVAAKDKENTQLKAEAELQAERQRGWVVAFGIALLGGALAAVALGMAVRRGRRLASVSAELAQRNGELEQRSASRIRLLAAACHDLRQPAHALGMLAELGDDARRDPSRFGAWLQSVRRSTASLSDMLDALMDLGRLDNGQYTPHTGPVSLAELLHEVTLHFGGLAQRKGLTLHVTPAEGEVVSDRHLLRRIVFNLVSNAIKYTDTGHVRVSLERGSHTVLLNVQDSGPGIPPDKLEEVFRDHVRLNPTKAAEGLGIGLSIVRRAAELLGHPLSLVSPPGQGTTATLQLPLAADGAARLVAQAAARADAPQGCVIGLLEDDADVREATAALLRRWGYTVYAAADAAALKNSLDPTRPPLSLLLSDLHLGSLNGLDELTQLRGALRAPTLPALLVTGDMDAAVAIQAARARVYVAHKPLAPGRLAEVVQDLVRAASHAEPQAAAQGVT
ncbi:MAG: response regulator [Pelomonas sp.]|nr:response regulator [Roseateles sp.]